VKVLLADSAYDSRKNFILNKEIRCGAKNLAIQKDGLWNLYSLLPQTISWMKPSFLKKVLRELTIMVSLFNLFHSL